MVLGFEVEDGAEDRVDVGVGETLNDGDGVSVDEEEGEACIVF